jgi:hypothetical protein
VTAVQEEPAVAPERAPEPREAAEVPERRAVQVVLEEREAS